MKPGVYSSLTNEQYHGGPGVSKSMLDILAKSSPLHLHAVRTADNDNARQPTPAQQFGTAFHALVLEPAEFAKDYCLGLRQQDVPDAIADRDTLVAMVGKLNETRLPKLSTSGTKDELVARVMAAHADDRPIPQPSGFYESMKLAELKAQIAGFNETRPGLLPDRGTMAELRDILNANGHQITLWADVKAEWQANNGHRNVLSADEWDMLHQMRDAVMAHPAARAILDMDGVAEHSVYWNDPETGALCRCRPDWWVKSRGIVLDVKTTTDASPEEFARSMDNWRYHVQQAMYLDGINAARAQMQADNDNAFPAEVHPPARAFLFLAVEKGARVVNGKPMGVAVYSLEPESVDLGRHLYRRDLATYAHCERTGTWPGYGDTIQSITLPGWAFSRNAALAA